MTLEKPITEAVPIATVAKNSFRVTSRCNTAVVGFILFWFIFLFFNLTRLSIWPQKPNCQQFYELLMFGTKSIYERLTDLD
jgi:hypothetical protein